MLANGCKILVISSFALRRSSYGHETLLIDHIKHNFSNSILSIVNLKQRYTVYVYTVAHTVFNCGENCNIFINIKYHSLKVKISKQKYNSSLIFYCFHFV